MIYPHHLMLCYVKLFGICEKSARNRSSFWFAVETTFSEVKFKLFVKHFNLQMKCAKESGCSSEKREMLGKTNWKRTKGLYWSSQTSLRSSDTISPNKMHEVSTSNTSESIPEVEEETNPGQIRNNEEADIESNIL